MHTPRQCLIHFEADLMGPDSHREHGHNRRESHEAPSLAVPSAVPEHVPQVCFFHLTTHVVSIPLLCRSGSVPLCAHNVTASSFCVLSYRLERHGASSSEHDGPTPSQLFAPQWPSLAGTSPCVRFWPKRRASTRPSPSQGHALRPTTHADTLREVVNDYAWFPRPLWAAE